MRMRTHDMKVSCICILSNNVLKLCAFYQKALNRKPSLVSLKYIEFELDGFKIAIYDVREHNNLADESSVVDGSLNHMLLEIEVTDIDAEYERLKKIEAPIVKELRIESWGSKSFYIRDPEGNIVNFFQRVQVPVF